MKLFVTPLLMVAISVLFTTAVRDTNIKERHKRDLVYSPYGLEQWPVYQKRVYYPVLKRVHLPDIQDYLSSLISLKGGDPGSSKTKPLRWGIGG